MAVSGEISFKNISESALDAIRKILSEQRYASDTKLVCNSDTGSTEVVEEYLESEYHIYIY